MNKSEIAELIDTYQISLDELIRLSNVSAETIRFIITNTGKPVNQKVLFKLKQAIDEILFERQLVEAARIATSGPKSIEKQLQISREKIKRLKVASMKLRKAAIAESENTASKGELHLIIDQGKASDEEVADLLSDISILYRMNGGSGINFEVKGINTLVTSSHV